MGIFDFGRQNRTSDRRGQVGADSMVPRYTSPPDRNTREWMAAYGKNPRLAVVDKIASDLSYAPGKLYRLDSKGGRQEIDKHPFLDFWQNPNPLREFTNSSLWKLQEIYLRLKGEGYFLIERYEDGTPAELWPVPPQWVQMTPYMGYPFYTIRVASGSIMEVSVDDMFVMKDLNPLDPYRRGLGQAEAVADEVEIDEYAAKFQKAFFYNDATPSTIITMPGASETQADRFLARWKERFRGVMRGYGVATVTSDVTVTKLGDHMKDLDMVNGRTFTRDAILEHFGVPREIMGITLNSNRATADAAQYIYAKNVLRPKLINRQEAVNQQLLPAYGEELLWEFDDIIPKDIEFDKGVAMEGWGNSLLTKNQSLELIGQETVPNGDIYKTSFADMFVAADEDIVEASSQAANLQYVTDPEPLEADRNQLELMDDEIILRKAQQIKARRVQSAGKSLAQARMQQQRKFEVATSRYLKSQADQVRAALEGKTKDDTTVWDALNITQEEFQALPEIQQQELITAFTSGLMDWKLQENNLEGILKPLWSETYSKGAENVKELYRLTSVQQPAMTSTARIRGGQRVTKVTQTTKDNISRIVTAGLQEGKGRQELTEAIMDEMNTSEGRARVIAAQECNTSLLAGNYDMAKCGGFNYKTWHTTNQGKARDTHKSLNGKTVRMDEAFVTDKGVELMVPCDPDCSEASETVNCHCFLTYS